MTHPEKSNTLPHNSILFYIQHLFLAKKKWHKQLITRQTENIKFHKTWSINILYIFKKQLSFCTIELEFTVNSINFKLYNQ